MKPLVYKPPKWEKNANSTLEGEAEYLKKYGDKPRGAVRCVERYLHPELDPPMLPHIDDPASCYFLMYRAYRWQYELAYMQEQEAECLENVYLAAAACCRSMELSGRMKVTNPAIERALEKHTEDADVVQMLIAVNEWESAQQLAETGDVLFYAFLTGDDETAQKIVAEMPDSLEQAENQRRAYLLMLQAFILQKQVYLAYLSRDAEALHAALTAYIRNYRKYPCDYSVVIDLFSSAMIKLARRRGMDIDLNLIEIPRCFLDESRRIDRSTVKLPELPDRVIEIGGENI